MGNLTLDDVDELWTAMRDDKSWRALRDVIDYRCPDGISRNLADDLLAIARRQQGAPFPSSKRDLYDQLRDELS